MKRGHLSEYFEGVAVKTLSAVDATPSKSNQHEIGTTVEMRRFLGSGKRQFTVRYMWLCGEQEGASEAGWATHYDTRENQPHRSPEWRLYYPSNPVTEMMAAGDTLFVAKRPGDVLLFIVTPVGSTIQNQLLWLFGFASQPELRFATQEYEIEHDAELDFTARFILDEIGIEFEDPDANNLDQIIERFGTTFPTTRVFSDLARLTLPAVDARDDPDAALIAWITHEEALFRRLERRAVTARLEQGFALGGDVDVDGFLQFSLQVQNRRKSRMGRAFENHLDAVFRAFELEFQWQATTENRNTVDFLFPGSEAYHLPGFPPDCLTVLAAKSSCKDRWRQILPEAQLIWPKHLVTLEPAISAAQTDQMEAERVQLVIPRSIQASYQPDQQSKLMSLAGFVELVRTREQI
jgi:restriction endonuclease EcoRII-like protein